jgi:hypothetical protein
LRTTSSLSTNARAVGHRIHRERLALEVGERLDGGRRHHRQEAAVAAHEGEQVGRLGYRGLALPFLIGDEVVDGGERNVVPAIEEAGHQRRGVRRIAQLQDDAVGFEEALALSCPERQVPAAVEGDHPQRQQARRRLRRRQAGGGQQQQRENNPDGAAWHCDPPLRLSLRFRPLRTRP